MLLSAHIFLLFGTELKQDMKPQENNTLNWYDIKYWNKQIKTQTLESFNISQSLYNGNDPYFKTKN